ncbi:prepilin-type N-terminal cleavage/methylation domain-containing protein [Hydrogenophaga sp.]|uniref:prepilin-type N-terminal cleavage/methylation domain-containing protein n=1 Tax=Hydrogenophaga sp. TaxID=1904254 RepID=UPI003F7126AF
MSRRHPHPHPPSARQHGFTLLAVLAAMFLLALASQQVMSVVSQQAQRDREAELLRIGAAYQAAIGAYHDQSPGSVKRWPPSLEALLDDRRFVTLQRHLRRLYADPITRTNTWGLVPAPDGGIAGIYSLSEDRPIRTGGTELARLGLAEADRYSEWEFVHRPSAEVVR